MSRTYQTWLRHYQPFQNWCRDLKRHLLFYGVGGGQVLSPAELERCYRMDCSIDQAFNISSDVAAGVSFEEAFDANTR